MTDARTLVMTALDSAIASLMTSRSLIQALIDADRPSRPVELEEPPLVGCQHPGKVAITTMGSEVETYLCPDCGTDDIVG